MKEPLPVRGGTFSRVTPILTPVAMRAAEAAWFADGQCGYALMTRAARAVAATAVTMAPAGPIVALCGPGNNGGDGLVAARLLRDAGRDVTVALLGDPAALAGDAARALADWARPLADAADALQPNAALVIDALFGIGLSRPPTKAAAELIARVNAGTAPVLAVDVPSGLDALTGADRGAIRATRTVTFHTLKPGHLLLPGRALCGTVEVADIGLPPTATPLTRNDPPTLTRPAIDAHKYARGGCLVWSGPALMTGASRLAACAALRAGAGAVWLAGEREALAAQSAHVTAVMLREADAAGFGRFAADAKVRSLVVGPGAGPHARAVAEAALLSGKPCVLDADALTAFAGDADGLTVLVARHPRAVVLTPHAGEFARLFPAIDALSKLDRALDAATMTGAVVVLKGPDTVIAAPDGRAAINANGTPWLATAGSGDVLAGITGGLLAQGMTGFDAARRGVWLHGAAGEAGGPWLTAEDLEPALRTVLASLPPAR